MSWQDIARRSPATTFTTLGLAVACMLVSGGSASAFIGRGAIEPAFGKFGNAKGVAINQETGNVYVIDDATSQIDVFGSELEAPTVGPASFNGESSPAASFAFAGEPAGPSVDNSCFITSKSGTACSSYDPSNGALYFPDVKHNRVDKYVLNGKDEYEFVCWIAGWNQPGNSCTATGGSPITPWSEPLGTAVDDDGNLYVASYSPAAIVEFNSVGEQVTVLNPPGGSPQYLAVTPTGTIYVLAYSTGQLWEMKRSSLTGAVEKAELFRSGVSGVAYNNKTGLVEVDRVAAVEEINASGESVGGSAPSALDESGGAIAVNESTNHLYVTDLVRSDLVRLGLGVLLPDATTDQPSPIGREKATLRGTVNPDKSKAVYWFEYGLTSTYEHASAKTSAGEGTAPVVESLGVNALKSGTVYHVRLVTENENGVNPGADVAFETSSAVEGLTTDPVTSVTSKTVELHGTVEPNELDAECWFEYGPALESKTAEVDEGSETVVKHITVSLNGLTPITGYAARFVCRNSLGISYGAVVSFTTGIAVEGVTTNAATEVGATTAKFNGSVTPNGLDAHCWFEYQSASEGINARTTSEDVGSEAATKQVHQPATGLEPNEAYFVRIACENANGTSLGVYETFQTAGLAPVIGTESTSHISRVRALLGGEINPGHLETTYYFEYGTTEAYGYATATTVVPSTRPEDIFVQATAGELESKTLYHFRVVARNAEGVAFGKDQTFTSGELTPPSVATGGATDINPTGATIAGTVTTEGLLTEYGFEIGTSVGNYGPPTGLGSVGAGYSESTATLELHNLQPNTTYYYRIVGSSVDGASEGEVRSFTTTTFPNPNLHPDVLRVLTEPFVEWPNEPEGIFPNEVVMKKGKPKAKAKHKGHGKHKHSRGKGKSNKKKGGASKK